MQSVSGRSGRVGAMLTFEVYKDKAGEWRWRLLAANHKVIADSSEGYQHQADCVAMITKVRADAHSAVITYP